MVEWEVLSTLNPWMDFMPMEQADSITGGGSKPTQPGAEMKANFKMWTAAIEQAKKDKR